MRKKDLLNRARFETEIHQPMIGKDLMCRPMTRNEYVRNELRLGLIKPKGKRKTQYPELGYIFSCMPYEVITWTSYVPALGRCNENDQVHVLIRRGDQVLYKTREIRRVGDFIRRMLCYTWISIFKASHPPLCDKCHKEMEITKANIRWHEDEKGNKVFDDERFRQVWWQCNEPHADGKYATKSWDTGLPPLALQFLKEMREPGQKYRNNLRKQGKSVFARAKASIGNRWIRTRKENEWKIAA